MARIRSIKPDFWQDEKLSPLSALDRLVFLGLISQADDAGRLVDNVKLIDGLLFPQTDDTSRESIATLARLKRVIRYTGPSGQRLIQIVRWKDHQKVDNPGSRLFPAPPAELLAAALDGEPSGESSEDIARVSLPDVGSGKGDVGKGKEEVGASTHPPAIVNFLAALETSPTGQNEQHWLSIIDGWRQGLGFEGGKAATGEDIATGLTEYLATEKRDFAVIHVRSFVERARRNRLKSATRPNGQSNEQATRVWALIKSQGILHRTTQREIDSEVQALVTAGSITSAAAFKTILKKLDFDLLRKAQQESFAVRHIAERLNGSTLRVA